MIQMWTQPVQADTTSIANGISEAGRGIGQGLAMRAADMKRREEDDKRKAEQAKKIRGMAKMFQEDIGLSDSEVQGKDANELGGLVEGYMLSQSSKHQKLQQERDALTIAAMKALERDRSREEDFNRELGGGSDAPQASPAPSSESDPASEMAYQGGPWDLQQATDTRPYTIQPGFRFDPEAAVSNQPYDPNGQSADGARLASEFANGQGGGMSTTLGQTNGLPPGMNMSNVLRAAARHGKLLDPRLDNLIKSMQGGAGTDWENLKPREGKTASGRPYIYGKGGQFQFEQTDLNPDGVKERTLSDGTVQAWNGKQWANASRPQRVPTDFTTKLGEMAAGFDDPKYGASARASVKASIDTAHTLKQLDDTQRDSLYEQFGLGKSKGGAAPAKDGMDTKAELQRARNAIGQGRSKASVMKLYKERTGQDFPDE